MFSTAIGPIPIVRSCAPSLCRFVLFAFLLAAIPTLHAGQPDDPAELLRLLEEGDFDARKAVEKKLEELGDTARAALEKAALSPSPELRQTAMRLLDRLSQSTLLIEVFDRDGKPLPRINAEVTLSDLAGQTVLEEPDDVDPHRQVVDDNGRLTFPQRQPGIYNLALNFPQYAPLAHVGGGLNSALLLQSGVNRYRIQLEACAEVQGTIQREDGTPLADATIIHMQAYQPVENDIDLNTVYVNGLQQANANPVNTGKEGIYGARDIAPGLYHFFVQHPDYETVAIASIQLGAGEKKQLPPMKLTRRHTPLGSVKMKFVDDKGEVLANRSLSAQFQQRRTPEQAARALRTMEALHRQGRYDEPPELSMIAVETNEHGLAEIKEIPVGTYDVVITDEDHEKFYYAAGLVAEAAPPEPAAAIKPATLGSIAGRLTNPAGTGLSNRNIYALDESQPFTQLLLANPERLTTFAYSIDELARNSLTDEDGKYTLEALSPGKYALIVLFESQPVALVPHIEVALGKKTDAPALSLKVGGHENFNAQGKVLLSDRTPAAGAMVYLVDRHGSSTAVNTTADGAFNTSWSAQPPVWLGVVAPGHAPLTQEFKSVNGPMEIVLSKETPGSLRVIATYADGRPVAGALVQVLPATQPGYLAGDSSYRPANAAGQILLRNLRPGKYRVRVWNPARNGLALGEAEVRTGEEARCEIKLAASARISGQILFANAANNGEAGKANPALASTQVTLTRASTPEEESLNWGLVVLTPDATGRFSSGPLAPGKYVIDAYAAGQVYANAKRVVKLEAGATAQFDVKLAPACAIRIQAAATDALSSVDVVEPKQWRPAQPKGVVAAEEDNDPKQASESVAFDGKALLRGVAPGTYDITLRRDTNDTQENGRTTEILRVVRDVRITAEHQKTPLDVRMPDLATPASIGGRFELAPEIQKAVLDGALDSSIFTLKLAFVGEDQLGVTTMMLSNVLNRQKLQVGTQPQVPGKGDEAAGVSERFLLEGLGTGELNCEAWLECLTQDGASWKNTSEKVTLRGLPAITKLAAGQKLDLGTLMIELPPDLLARLTQESQRRTEQTMRQNLMYATQLQPVENFQP